MASSSRGRHPVMALALLLAARHLTAAAAAATALTPSDASPCQQHILEEPSSAAALTQTTIPARYCPGGGALEGGLCYARCKAGWHGLGCHCWRRGRSYRRGCGSHPAVCQVASFRRQVLPPPGADAQQPFTLVLSADPQLFRVVTDYDDRARAMAYNARLVESINAAQQLGAWPPEAGGGRVSQPRSLVVLGDLTEFYTSQQADGFRQLYDDAYPRDLETGSSSSGGRGGRGGRLPHVALPTWLLLGNHDVRNNVNDCRMQYRGGGRNVCARAAVDTMRSVLTPGCDATTWSNFPRSNVTSFDASSLAYSFNYGTWHFVVLQYNPRYAEASLALAPSMAWLAAELSAAAAQARRVVLLLHAHRELGLAADPTFTRLLAASSVAAIFYGHVHVPPWGYAGTFPATRIPMYNCGASWYHVYCLAEFGRDTMRIAAVTHDAASGSSAPRWHGVSVHGLLRQARVPPVLLALKRNPPAESAARVRCCCGRPLRLLLVAVSVAVALLAA